VLIDAPFDAYDERVERTRRAIADGAVAIYEAAFRADGVSVAVDILERDGSGFRLVEVKSSTWVKETFIADVAVQAHVARRNGVDIVGTDVMHLNRACRYPDLANLFVRADVTEAARAVESHVPAWIAAQLAMLEGPLPEVTTGPHCSTPHECPFWARCWPALPPHHVSTLYKVKLPRAVELDALGYRLISDLPDDGTLPAIQERQRRAVRENRIVVDPALGEALTGFVPPIAFLDFESIALAIPVWEGCHPYDFVPVQFSCHVEDVDGHVTHHEWLAEGAADPRPALAARLVEACGSARTVVAYGAGFERRCLEHLADAVPALAPALVEIAGRVVDLLPVIRNHVYHPEFGGSFGLKSVLPALVPELGYDDLTIADGMTATLELERLLFRTDEQRDRVDQELRRYCERDTRGLVELLKHLKHLAQGS
jgi:hypothetical protein